MTRDSAAVASLDDRRRCPISAADDVSSLMTNSIATSCSSSNGDVGGGDEGCSPKSSSAVSTTTSCCGRSSSSSRSCSDDDDSAAVAVLSTTIEDGCSAAIKTSPLPLLHKEVVGDNTGDKDSSRSSNNDDVTATTTSTNIGGRLTFYKDGKFIFQLAAHHQQHPYNNRTALTSQCRWIPVPTVIQQHKNNVKSIGEWSQHHQNKTIWPYLVTNPASDSKSPQSLQQSQLPIVRIGERKSQQYQPRMKSPPLKLNDSTVNIATHTGAVVMATTTNIVRRPSRKCSTTTAVENSLDMQHRQLQSHLRPLSRRLQQHQHQSFMMVATEAVKAQRRLLSVPRMKRRRCRKTKIAMNKDSLLQEQQSLINLECVVQNLWCRRHTTALLLRRQLSLNNNVELAATTDTSPPVSRIVAVTTVESMSCSNMGSGKRRSVFSPLPTITTPVTTSIMTNSIINITGSNSPHKKYRLGQQQVLQQQRRIVDKCVKKTVSTSSSQPQIMSTNDHSITAILSGGAVGAKRPNGCGITTVVDTEISVISSSTSNAILTPQNNPLAPISLLRTLLKSPSSESNTLPVVASTNDSNYRHNTSSSSSSSRKRSAIESTTPIVATSVATTVETGPRTTAMAIPPTAGLVNDATLTALHQIPTLHHPAAAGQLAAAGYFNVLYHQAAMAAAMAYQTHAQLPQSLPKSQPPPMLSSQFSPTVDVSSSWQRQLNRQPLLPPLKTIGGNGVASVSSSASTIVAPYSSPLITAAVNGCGLLTPATPSPPPSLLLHPHSVHHHNLLLHHQQQYQQVPTVQQSSYHQHKQRQQGSSSSGIRKRTMVTMGAIKYDNSTGGNNLAVVAAIDEESSSTADCVPLNLSKDSVAEKVEGTSSTATVR